MSDIIFEDKSSQYVGPDGRVDVQKLIKAYGHEEHALRADAYFASVSDPWTHHLRKPFSSLHETPAMLASYGVVLQMLQPRPDQVVVDFGCGTGWLSHAMALMGCRAIGLDISEAALNIARDATAAHPYLRDRPVTFLRIGDGKIPLEDESVDRLVCFDSFHHVADQAVWLSEFYRVLKPGGRAAFNEPGPNHAESDTSQHEMRQFGVIENNIVASEIRDTAYALGFTDMKMALFQDVPVMVSLEDHDLAIEQRSDIIMNHLGKAVAEGCVNRRVFVMVKPGEEAQDSRYLQAFAASISAVARPIEGGSAIKAALTNVGSGAWRPSGGEAGCVNLGVSTFLNGKPLLGEPERYMFIHEPVLPGQTVEVTFDIMHPPGAVIRLDMVSELVAWSSMNGGTPWESR